jgi:ribonuclease HI
VVITDNEGQPVATISRYLGDNHTNNFAEYQALDLGLEEALNQGYERAEVLSDSELLVRQLQGHYKVKSENLKPLFQNVRDKIRKFRAINIKHIPRDKNKEADKLANKAIDEVLE